MFALFPTVILSVSGWLALRASATAIPFSAGTVLHGLLARQTDPLADLPPACKTGCGTVLTNIQNCASIACLCTTANSRLLQTCVECLISFAPGEPTVVDAGQNVYDRFDEACSGTGIPSHTLFAPGPSSTSSRSTSRFPSGSATAPPVTDVFPTTTSPVVQFTVTTVPEAAPQTSAAGSFVPPASRATTGRAGGRCMLGIGVAVGLVVGAVVGIV